MESKGVFILSSWRGYGYKRQGPRLCNASSGAWVVDPSASLAPLSCGIQAFLLDSKIVFGTGTIYSQCNYFCDVCSPSPYPRTRKWSHKGEGEVSQRHTLEGRRGQKRLSQSEERRRESDARNCEQRSKGKWQRLGWERSRAQLRKAVEAMRKCSSISSR